MTTFRAPTTSSFLRPLAGVLMLAMAGSVYATATPDACLTDAQGQILAERDNLLRCAAALPSDGTVRAAQPAANDLHPHLGFASNHGDAAEAIGDDSMAMGRGAVAGDEIAGQALAIGPDAKALAWSAVAVGMESEVTTMGGIALGYGAQVVGTDGDAYTGGAQNGVAIGTGARVAGNRGDGWMSEGTAGVAIGYNAWAAGDNSVALGSDSKAFEDNTVAVGSESQRRRIVNLNAGTGEFDAVNVAQLKGAAAALGGGAAIDPVTGAFLAPSYAIQGGAYQSVGEALGALDEGLSATNARVDELAAGGGGGDTGLIEQDADGTLTVGKATGGSVVDFTGTDGARVLTGVADGRLGAGSTEAVNGGQLAAIRDELSGRVEGLSGRVDQLEAGAPGEGVPPGGGQGPGNDAGGRPIGNVGDGVADSDAANVGQVNQQVEQALSTANRYTDQRVDALAGALDSFKGEVNDRFARQDQKINRMGAMNAATSQMAINAAGVSPGKGRVAMGVGLSGGEKAMAVGYAKSISPKVRMSIGGSFAGSQTAIGAGMGFDL
jgi:trimeric autotransporter adhesin